MASATNKPWPRRIASWAWLLAVSLTTLEIAARLDDWLHYDAPLFGHYDFDRMFRATENGVRGVPGARYLRWRLNDEGFNGPPLRPEEGQRRVVVYGASESFGIYEDAGKEFPRALERDLNAHPETRVEVINAGIPGMRVGSGVALLAELGKRLRPAAVVIYPTPTHYIGVSRPYCGRPPSLPNRDSSGWPESRAAAKFKDQVKRVAPAALLRALRRLSIGWQTRGRTPLTHVDEASLAAYETDLRCALAAARGAGMTPLLVTHASRFGVPRAEDADWLTGWRQQYPEMAETGFIDLEQRANDTVRRVARVERVALIDAAAALGGQPALFADHAHFTNEGAARMAALLAPAVRAALAVRPAPSMP